MQTVINFWRTARGKLVIIGGGVFVGLILLCLICAVFGMQSGNKDNQGIFSRYLTSSSNKGLLQNATNVQADELSMGQGVYLRFEVDKKLVMEFLEDDHTNPYSYHYPYKSIACQEFYEVYPDWADKWPWANSWWRPRDIMSAECYVTRGCEYFLFDKDSKTVYYYFFPDFLGKDYLCVENESKN